MLMPNRPLLVVVSPGDVPVHRCQHSLAGAAPVSQDISNGGSILQASIPAQGYIHFYPLTFLI